MLGRPSALPAGLHNESIPEEVLLSLAYAADAGPCPEYLLPLKKGKTPKVRGCAWMRVDARGDAVFC